MEVLKTPENQFDNLPGYSFQSNFINVASAWDNAEGVDELLMHYVDFGDKSAPIIMMLHGEPSWSYLYRHMIDKAASEGFRVIAPDLIGFGKSDKYAQQSAYTYANHLNWLNALIDKLGLKHIHLICQDWGGLLGLRILADRSDLFSACVAANTMLPTGDYHPGQAFVDWQHYSQNTKIFDCGNIIQNACEKELIEEIVAAYNAPFPEEKYKAGARKFPMLVPITPDDPEAQNNRLAWGKLQQFKKPFLTAFSDKDPITAGGDKVFQKLVPGCKDQAHVTLKDAGHFLQEDCGDQLISHAITLFKGA
jgi:haloalkane dehalogenase